MRKNGLEKNESEPAIGIIQSRRKEPGSSAKKKEDQNQTWQKRRRSTVKAGSDKSETES